MTQTIDLRTYIANNATFKSQTLKVNKLTDAQEFITDGAIEGQVELVKKGGKLVLNVYKLAGAVKYTFKAVETYYDGHSKPYTKTVYTRIKDKYGTTISYDKTVTQVNKSGKNSKKHYVYKNGKYYKTVSSAKDFINYNDVDSNTVSKAKLGSYTITNTSGADEGIQIFLNGQDILQMEWKVEGSTSGYFAGSQLNEYSNSTAKNEHFHLGEGKDAIYFQGHANYGTDVIDVSKNSFLSLVFSNEPVRYDIKNNDAILYLGDQDGSAGKVILKNYMSQKTASVTVNGTDLVNKFADRVLGNQYASTRQILIGTRFNETFYCGTKNDVVVTGGGDDNIYSGTGDDTIKINQPGRKDIHIGSGSGRDTIVRDGLYASGTAYLHFNVNPNAYVKDGNNLIIQRGEEETVVKGFFGEGYAFKYTFLNGETASLGSQLKDSAIKLLLDRRQGPLSGAKGSKYSDIIYGGKRTSSIDAGKGNNELYVYEERVGKTTLKAGDGNDVYHIQNDMSNSKNVYTIVDGGGNDDKIVCTSPGMFAYFNVSIDKKGDFASNETTLHFLETSKVFDAESIKKGVAQAEKITIKNALKKNDSDATDKGWIETVNGLYKSSYTVNLIRNEVANWLSNNDYTSVSQALSKADQASLTQLMNIYINNYSV